MEALAVLLLIGLSAVFSGLESALFSLSEVKLRGMEQERPLPTMLRLWLEKPNDVLATLLIGNNVANITASALATDLTHRMLSGGAYDGWAIPVAVGVMTLLVLIFGEVVPKTFAKHHPERYLATLPILRLTHFLAWPAARVLVGLTNRVLGDKSASEGVVVTEEDIENLVRIGKQDGSIAPEATRLLTGVLELDEKIAREVMVPRTEIEGLPIDADLSDVVQKVEDTGFSRYPVYEETIDNVVGILYVKDLLAHITQGAKVKLADVMRTPLFRPENIDVSRLLIEMKRERVHLVILASEYGGVEGLVTLEDIVEEVFGPIYDEHDTREGLVKMGSDGHYLVDGICTLSEFSIYVGQELKEEEDYETIGGLLMKASGTVPEQGYVHEQEGFRFEVLDSDSTRVLGVRVARLDEEDSEEREGGGPGDVVPIDVHERGDAEMAARDGS